MMEVLVAGGRRLGVELTQVQVEQFELYYRELVEWNERFNLTAVTGYEDVQARHFLDSLTALLPWGDGGRELPSAARVVDVGAGAGLPGLPLKLVRPDLRLTLVESTGKKAGFLRHLVDRLGLAEVEVAVARAEELAHDREHRAAYDVALARAVAALPALAELTLPFLRVGGRLVAHKKGAIDAELSAAGRAIRLLGGRPPERLPVSLPELPDERFLIVVRKAGPTPASYPRRPGLPAKHPL